MITTPTTQPAVCLERLIPAPPEQVYRAWLDPQLVRRWRRSREGVETG
jgi:uncharacterized protein YndB with AHSA1/START domain